MSKQKSLKTPREYFMRAVDDELAKFELKENAFQKADRDERAAKLGLPVPGKPSAPLKIRTPPRTL